MDHEKVNQLITVFRDHTKETGDITEVLGRTITILERQITIKLWLIAGIVILLIMSIISIIMCVSLGTEVTKITTILNNIQYAKE